MWRHLGLRYDEARTRLAIAGCLRQLGDEATATLELDAAGRILTALGAQPDRAVACVIDHFQHRPCQGTYDGLPVEREPDGRSTVGPASSVDVLAATTEGRVPVAQSQVMGCRTLCVTGHTMTDEASGQRLLEEARELGGDGLGCEDRRDVTHALEFAQARVGQVLGEVPRGVGVRGGRA